MDAIDRAWVAEDPTEDQAAIVGLVFGRWFDRPVLEDVAPPTDGPVTTWGRVVEVLGISRDTLERRRRTARDPWGRTPWFEDAAAVFAWWRAVVEPRPTTAIAPTIARAVTGRALDAEALRDEFGLRATRATPPRGKRRRSSGE